MGFHEHEGDEESRVPTPEEVFVVVTGHEPSASTEEAARALLRDSLIPALNTLAHLAVYGVSEKVRLEASRYIVDRNLGRIADKAPLGDMWDQLFREIMANHEAESGH